MCKSLGNWVAIGEPPDEQFGKLMRIPDPIVGPYATLTTDLHPAEVDELAEAAAAGRAGGRDVKRRLAREVVTLYHGPEAAAAAEAASTPGPPRPARLPTDVPAACRCPPRDPVHVLALLVDAGLVASTSEARRLVGEGAVRVDGQPVGSIEQAWPGRAGRAPADRRPPDPGPPPGAAGALTGFAAGRGPAAAAVEPVMRWVPLWLLVSSGASS